MRNFLKKTSAAFGSEVFPRRSIKFIATAQMVLFGTHSFFRPRAKQHRKRVICLFLSVLQSVFIDFFPCAIMFFRKTSLPIWVFFYCRFHFVWQKKTQKQAFKWIKFNKIVTYIWAAWIPSEFISSKIVCDIMYTLKWEVNNLMANQWNHGFLGISYHYQTLQIQAECIQFQQYLKKNWPHIIPYFNPKQSLIEAAHHQNRSSSDFYLYFIFMFLWHHRKILYTDAKTAYRRSKNEKM